MAKIEISESTLQRINHSHALRYAFRDLIHLHVPRKTFKNDLINLWEDKQNTNSSINKNEIINILDANVEIEEPYYEAVLTNFQYEKLVNYLEKGDFYRRNFTSKKNRAKYLLAFSYGEGHTVNSEIRKEIEDFIQSSNNTTLEIYAQWEIADFAPFTNNFNSMINRIAISPGKSYINSYEVAEKFIKMTNYQSQKSPGVLVACQSWHGARCLNICQNKGINIIGGIFVDKFSVNDPQLWVQDPLSWLIKES